MKKTKLLLIEIFFIYFIFLIRVSGQNSEDISNLDSNNLVYVLIEEDNNLIYEGFENIQSDISTSIHSDLHRFKFFQQGRVMFPTTKFGVRVIIDRQISEILTELSKRIGKAQLHYLIINSKGKSQYADSNNQIKFRINIQNIHEAKFDLNVEQISANDRLKFLWVFYNFLSPFPSEWISEDDNKQISVTQIGNNEILLGFSSQFNSQNYQVSLASFQNHKFSFDVEELQQKINEKQECNYIFGERSEKDSETDQGNFDLEKCSLFKKAVVNEQYTKSSSLLNLKSRREIKYVVISALNEDYLDYEVNLLAILALIEGSQPAEKIQRENTDSETQLQRITEIHPYVAEAFLLLRFHHVNINLL